MECAGISKTGPRNAPQESATVADAFEGREYAEYFWINTKGQKYWEGKPFVRKLRPPNADEILCKSQNEFDYLIDKHFGIGR